MRFAKVVVWALIFAGCGDLTSGGGPGEVEVFATADEPSVNPPSAAAELRVTPLAVARASRLASPFDGLLIAELEVYLQADATGEWIPATEGVRDLTLDLRGGSERRVAVRFIDSGLYTRLRVVFRRVEASVTGGVIVDGVPLIGTIAVDLGPSGSLTVEREMALEVEREENVDVVVDMNVDVWLPKVSVATRTVPAAALRDALAVRLR